MKGIVCLFLVLLSGNLLKGQVKVVDIDPDIQVCMDSLNFHIYGGEAVGDSVLRLDLDSNGVDDLYMEVFKKGEGVYFHSQSYSISATPLNGSRIAVDTGNALLAEVFDTVDFTTGGSAWSGAHSVLDTCHKDVMLPQWDTCFGKWDKLYDKFMAISILRAPDTILAYLRIDCDSNWCLVLKEYRYIPPPAGTGGLTDCDHLAVNPNPTAGLLRIRPDPGDLSVDIYNMYGRLVGSQIRSAGFNLRQYAGGPGIYILKIRHHQQQVFRKVVLE